MAFCPRKLGRTWKIGENLFGQSNVDLIHMAFNWKRRSLRNQSLRPHVKSGSPRGYQVIGQRKTVRKSVSLRNSQEVWNSPHPQVCVSLLTETRGSETPEAFRLYTVLGVPEPWWDGVYTEHWKGRRSYPWRSQMGKCLEKPLEHTFSITHALLSLALQGPP